MSVVVRVLAQESVFKSWLCLYQIRYLTSLCLSLIICKMEEMIIDLCSRGLNKIINTKCRKEWLAYKRPSETLTIIIADIC